MKPLHVAVVGAGWAGLAAAVAATRSGHRVTVMEASRALGGRARSLAVQGPDGSAATLDNGQHIMIGAYLETLALMRQVGVDPTDVLLRLPLTLRLPDGNGIALPDLPPPLDALVGIARARGWGWRDKMALLRTATAWQLAGFQCGSAVSVADLCARITPRVMAQLIEPLCVSALNTPASRASGQVFLRVLRDSLFGRGDGAWRGSNLLLPRVDLGRVFPGAAARWLREHGGEVLLGQRVQAIVSAQAGWAVDGRPFDRLVLACPPWDAARLVAATGLAPDWVSCAQTLTYEAITTVYTAGPYRLSLPMLSLHSGPDAPAQFVFDRGQLGGPAGVLAFVVSASSIERDVLQAHVLAQAVALGWTDLKPLQTVVEKRATFACTPGLERPAMRVAPGLLACGDYVQGPYPSTLEGAVRAALAAAAELGTPGAMAPT